MSKRKALEIDMCAGSELKDTQGETLSVEGADISDLEAGKGRFNDNHGKGFFNSLGRVTEAKKILKAEDCETERHKYYWDKIKAPYIYVRGKLYDDEDHPNAKAAAAIMRNIHREDAPLSMKASVEGGVISRGIKDSTRLARTKIHSVALTFTPANNATLVEPLDLDKSYSDWEADKQLIKSVMHLAETDIPSFRHIERHASAHTIHENILKIKELAKTIGVDIEVKELDPKSIMNQAVMHKIHSNINKINKIVKAFQNDARKWQMSNVPKAVSTTQPDIIDDKIPDPKVEAATEKQAKFKGDLKALRDKVVGDTKSFETSKLSTEEKHVPVSGIQQKANVVVGRHAKKAATNPAHLDNIYNQLKESHGHEKASAAILKIKQSMKKSIKESMIKALMAGYGGAGAPTNLSGGGSIQSESLDDGRTAKNDMTGMSYISCDNCGKEQVAMKHQVKCRDCNKNFSLDKLNRQGDL